MLSGCRKAPRRLAPQGKEDLPFPIYGEGVHRGIPGVAYAVTGKVVTGSIKRKERRSNAREPYWIANFSGPVLVGLSVFRGRSVRPHKSSAAASTAKLSKDRSFVNMVNKTSFVFTSPVDQQDHPTESSDTFGSRSLVRRSFYPCPRLGRRRSPRSRPARRCSGATGAGVVANFWQIFVRFRLYRHRSLQVNARFEAFFKTYQII